MTTAADAGSFDTLPEVYDRFGQLTGAQLRDRLAGILPARGGRAFDGGCGTGRHAELLADRYEDVLAVDISKPMLEFARQHRSRPNITYAWRDLEEVLPGTDGPFDLVFSAYTFHHLTDPAAAATRCRELVAPGGRVVLVDVVADPGLVGADGRLPRWYFEVEAVRGFGRDLAAGRPYEEAAELQALKLDPRWLDHQASDRLFTPEQFVGCYLAELPGAEISDLYRARLLCWDATR